MAQRSSKIGRIRQYFKGEPLDEVEVVLSLVQRDVAARQTTVAEPTPFHKKPRVKRAKKLAEPTNVNESASAVAS
jgi:hypothetical protein